MKQYADIMDMYPQYGEKIPIRTIKGSTKNNSDSFYLIIKHEETVKYGCSQNVTIAACLYKNYVSSKKKIEYV